MGFDEHVSQWLSTWARQWRVPDLANEVTVRFSPRLRSTWARVQIKRRVISLNVELKDAPRAELEEILCHEFAHIAANVLHRERVRPHGPEWASLVEKAGFRPARRKGSRAGHEDTHGRPQRRYEHWCPVCQMRRTARRPVPSWRCATCVESGLEGLLRIRTIPESETGR